MTCSVFEVVGGADPNPTELCEWVASEGCVRGGHHPWGTFPLRERHVPDWLYDQGAVSAVARSQNSNTSRMLFCNGALG